MASAAETSPEQLLPGRIEHTLRGWHSPRPISIRLAPESIASIRAMIARNLAALTPRCEELERLLPEPARRHPGYVASKVRHTFSLETALSTEVGGSAIPRLTPPEPRIRQETITAGDASFLGTLFKQRVLAVGNIADRRLRVSLLDQMTRSVAPGEGSSGEESQRRRPAAESFSYWMAETNEVERAGIGCYILGKTAGLADVDLLTRRLYSHQAVLVEVGSSALNWLLARWDGAMERCGAAVLFQKPGKLFSQPSGDPHMAAEIDWPRISVITTSYNQRAYLEQCLDSVLNQGYPNLEYIVIDANSTDGSAEILRRREAQFSRLVIEPDEGQSDGLNKGFRFATGDILTWINSDDMLAPLALKRAALAFATSGADLVAGTCWRIRGAEAGLWFRHHSALPADRVVPLDLASILDWSDVWEKGDYFFQPEVLFTREIWERAGAYLKPHLYWAMDWDLWLRFALAGASVVRVPDVLGVSRVHEAQKTVYDGDADRLDKYLWQIANIMREYDDLLAHLEQRQADS